MSEGVFIAMLTQRFEDVVKPVDVVFDMVGGDTLQRSWQVVKPGGVLVSVVSPRPFADVAKGHDARFAWFVVVPNREHLIQIGTLIDAGHIRPIVETVLPLSEARQAYEQGAKGHTSGRIVLRLLTPNFERIWLTCSLTVPGACTSAAAISWLEAPPANNCSTSSSRWLNGSGKGWATEVWAGIRPS
jgi:hypothetical protein